MDEMASTYTGSFIGSISRAKNKIITIGSIGSVQSVLFGIPATSTDTGQRVGRFLELLASSVSFLGGDMHVRVERAFQVGFFAKDPV